MKKIASKIILIVPLIIIVLAFVYIDFNNLKCKKLLESYGWNIISGGRSNYSFVLSDSLLNEEVFGLKRDASKAAGYDPVGYLNKSIDVYRYTLKESGLKENLHCELWSYKNDIICCFITHHESNLRIKFWPVNSDYAKIKSELESLKEEL